MQSRDDIGKAYSKCKDPARKPDAETADVVEEMAGGGEQIVQGNVLQTGGLQPTCESQKQFIKSQPTPLKMKQDRIK